MNSLDVIQYLSEYYGKQLSDSALDTYLGTLDDVPADLLDMAAKHLIKTGHPFMPKVVEIRKAARTIEVEGKYEHVDPLKLIPGAAQTEADLDDRYGSIETYRAICDVFTSGGSLSDSQRAILELDAHS